MQLAYDATDKRNSRTELHYAYGVDVRNHQGQEHADRPIHSYRSFPGS